MLYRIYPQTDAAKFYMEPHSGSSLPFLTVKKMRKIYPDDHFTVIGEIGGISRPPDNGNRLVTETGEVVPILPRGSLRRPFEWVAGYVAVDKSTYLAAIRSLIPSFLRRQWADQSHGDGTRKPF
ncbi:conserved hypothetical protein [uncultured Eubacteriales bacterium]|uniref:Uncharacterized protein n=1 Tax=uncultured Eubacteriales bacterium TaxID=172733 RepID=A0A212KHH8_9FIRM|nr:conserved hypothetical protein [uncultured Eubacteriales bacterium]